MEKTGVAATLWRRRLPRRHGRTQARSCGNRMQLDEATGPTTGAMNLKSQRMTSPPTYPLSRSPYCLVVEAANLYQPARRAAAPRRRASIASSSQARLLVQPDPERSPRTTLRRRPVNVRVLRRADLRDGSAREARSRPGVLPSCSTPLARTTKTARSTGASRVQLGGACSNPEVGVELRRMAKIAAALIARDRDLQEPVARHSTPPPRPGWVLELVLTVLAGIAT
jgi:hypothetical protein